MNKWRIMIVAFITVLFLSLTVSAAFTYEADAMFRAAQTYLESNDIKNSLRSLHIARGIYDKNRNEKAVMRCDEMLSEIDKTVSKSQLAEYYYEIAGDYFIAAGSSKCDVDSLQMTIDMAKRGKEAYRVLGGIASSQGILKSEDLINSATVELNKCEADKYREAENMFNMAKSQFFLEEYLLAREFALNASDIYSKIPDAQGMSKTATLLGKIDENINQIKINAAASYDKALRLYAAKNLDESMEYAAASQRLYNRIRDEDGYMQASNLISKINDAIGADADRKFREAKKYISDAETYYTIGDYVNATESAKNAKEIYEYFETKAGEREAHLQPSQRVETRLWGNRVKEVNTLLADIQSSWGEVRIRETADLYYKTAQEQMLKNRLNEALAYANNARSLYSDLTDYVGISKTDTLVEQIKTKMQLITQADIFFRSGRSFYNVAEFENAYAETSKAKAIYDDVLDANKSAEAQILLDKIRDGDDKKEEATTHYRKAQAHYEVLDYENALEWAKKANVLYKEINYSIGIVESQTIITESEEYIHEEWVKTRNLMIGAGIVVIIAVVLILKFTTKEKTLEEEAKARRDVEEERSRRREDESALEVEKETKERVEDELRRLIEQERSTRTDAEDKL
ncbi:MAG: hypothetical protein ABIH11_04595 [Candidatus Altiarchaeota archaeon]